jgi:hypothetical protein
MPEDLLAERTQPKVFQQPYTITPQDQKLAQAAIQQAAVARLVRVGQNINQAVTDKEFVNSGYEYGRYSNVDKNLYARSKDLEAQCEALSKNLNNAETAEDLCKRISDYEETLIERQNLRAQSKCRVYENTLQSKLSNYRKLELSANPTLGLRAIANEIIQGEVNQQFSANSKLIRKYFDIPANMDEQKKFMKNLEEYCDFADVQRTNNLTGEAFSNEAARELVMDAGIVLVSGMVAEFIAPFSGGASVAGWSTVTMSKTQKTINFLKFGTALFGAMNASNAAIGRWHRFDASVTGWAETLVLCGIMSAASTLTRAGFQGALTKYLSKTKALTTTELKGIESLSKKAEFLQKLGMPLEDLSQILALSAYGVARTDGNMLDQIEHNLMFFAMLKLGGKAMQLTGSTHRLKAQSGENSSSTVADKSIVSAKSWSEKTKDLAAQLTPWIKDLEAKARQTTDPQLATAMAGTVLQMKQIQDEYKIDLQMFAEAGKSRDVQWTRDQGVESIVKWLSDPKNGSRYPSHHSNDRYEKHLGGIVGDLRKFYNSKKLSDEHIKQLEAAGFEWKVGKSKDEQWTRDQGIENMLKWLLDPKNAGSYPRRYSTDAYEKRLGGFVGELRLFYKNQKLSDEQIKQLEDAGFEWKVGKAKDEVWTRDQGIKSIVNWLSDPKNGGRYPNARSSDTHEKQLGSWVHRLRKLYNNKKLSDEHIKQLEDAGFEWKVGKSKDEVWTRDQGIEKIVQWLRNPINAGKYPSPYSEDAYESRLGRLVTTLRQLYNDQKISNEHVQQLENAGFEWKVGKSKDEQWTRDQGIENMLKWLRDPKNIGRYPSYRSKNIYEKRLGSLVANLRRSYIEQKLSLEYIEKLDQAGFDWNPGAKQTKKVVSNTTSLAKSAPALPGKPFEVRDGHGVDTRNEAQVMNLILSSQNIDFQFEKSEGSLARPLKIEMKSGSAKPEVQEFKDLQAVKDNAQVLQVLENHWLLKTLESLHIVYKVEAYLVPRVNPVSKANKPNGRVITDISQINMLDNATTLKKIEPYLESYSAEQKAEILQQIEAIQSHPVALERVGVLQNYLNQIKHVHLAKLYETHKAVVDAYQEDIYKVIQDTTIKFSERDKLSKLMMRIRNIQDPEKYAQEYEEQLEKMFEQNGYLPTDFTSSNPYLKVSNTRLYRELIILLRDMGKDGLADQLIRAVETQMGIDHPRRFLIEN